MNLIQDIYLLIPNNLSTFRAKSLILYSLKRVLALSATSILLH